MSTDSLGNDLDSEKLLQDNSDVSSHNDVDEYLIHRRIESRQIRRYKFASIILVTLLIATNFGWWWWAGAHHNVPHVSHVPHSEEHQMGPPKLDYFLHEKDPEEILYSFEHDWVDLEWVEWGDDKYRYGDVHWKTTFPEGGSSVAVSQQFVEENNLWPGAAATEENATEFHYLVAGYHQLHCLSVVRDTIYYLNGTLVWSEREGTGPDEPFMWDHVIHCMEAVRQALACNLDPTLIPLDSYWPGIPNGQLHVCRNRDALYKWTTEHGRQYPMYVKQAAPARTQEWYDRTKHLNVAPWKPDPNGPPVDPTIHN